MRIGLISDLHWMREPPSSAAGWHGVGGEFAGVQGRLTAALEHFAASEVDLVAVCGDLAHHGDLESLAAVLGVLAGAGAPVIAVAGNHDVTESPDRLAEAMARVPAGDVSLAAGAGEEVAGLPVAGVQVGESSGWFRARLAAAPSLEDWGQGPLVLLSHYPVLSLAEEVAARGLPYPGDLLDRAELAEALAARQAPTVVLSGHVHVRATRSSGPVLQLSAGALVEPPYECAVVEVAGGGGELRVSRRCLRLLGGPVAGEPVFAPEEEEWRFVGSDWEASCTGAPGTAVPR
jgi:predicted phosphodiesterase